MRRIFIFLIMLISLSSLTLGFCYNLPTNSLANVTQHTGGDVALDDGGIKVTDNDGSAHGFGWDLLGLDIPMGAEFNVSFEAKIDHDAGNSAGNWAWGDATTDGFSTGEAFRVQYDTTTDYEDTQSNPLVASAIDLKWYQFTIETSNITNTSNFYVNGTNKFNNVNYGTPQALKWFNVWTNQLRNQNLWVRQIYIYNSSFDFANYECIIVPVVNNFTVTLRNNWSTSSMSNFSILLDQTTTLTTPNSSIITSLLSNDTSLHNITFIKDGYYNRSYFDLNVSSNFLGDLFQSQINLTAKELFSGISISNFSINLTGHGIVLNTTGNSGFIYPNVGNYTGVVIDNTGADDFHTTNKTFEVFALDNKTHVFRIHQHIINITAQNILNNASISNFSISVINLNITDTRTFNTTSGYIEVPAIHNTYNITVIGADDYAVIDNNGSNYAYNLITVSSDVNHTFYLYQYNSIWFYIYNRSDFTLLNTTTVTIALHGSTVDYSFTTTNGTYFSNNLNSDTYAITFTSPITSPTILYGTLHGGDFLTFDVYLQDNLVSKDFLVKDTLSNFLGDVVITFTQIINGSEITVGQTTTDFSGRASIFLSSSQDYNFITVKSGFDTFTGSVTPTQSEYSIIMTQTGLQRFVSVFEDVILTTGIDYTTGDTNAIPYLIINSINGRLQYYGMNTTYNAIPYLTNNTGTPAGGIEELNITPLLNNDRLITVTYFFKATGYDLVTWDVPYYLINLTPTNMTYKDGLFDDIDALEEFNPIRAGIGMFIIIVLILMFAYGSNKDFSAMVIGAMLGLGICYFNNLLPDKLTSVALIVLGVILISDNVGGGR